MSLLDVLNSDKDRAALDAVIDHAAQAVVTQLVPALEAAGTRLIDHLADRMEAVLTKANTEAQDDLKLVVADATALLHGSIAEVTAAIKAFDGSTITLALGGQKLGGI